MLYMLLLAGVALLEDGEVQFPGDKLVPTDTKEAEGELREGCQSKKRGKGC